MTAQRTERNNNKKKTNRKTTTVIVADKTNPLHQYSMHSFAVCGLCIYLFIYLSDDLLYSTALRSLLLFKLHFL